MNPYVMNIPESVILDAAHACYALTYADVYEEKFGRGLGHGDLCELVDPIDSKYHLPIMWRYIGQIEQAWGTDLFLVFHHMGITESDKDMTHALTDLFLGCMGHGVTIHDDFDKELAHAARILHFNPERSPMNFEGEEWRELAEHFLPEA